MAYRTRRFLRSVPLEDSFQELVMHLYRRWYALPRKSAQHHVNRLRLDLAQGIDASAAAADTRYQEAIRSFLAGLKRLPQVEEEAGEALRTVENSLSDPQDAQISADRLPALAALLRVSSPATHAIANMHFIPSQLGETWQTTIEKLETGWGGFSETTRQQIDSARRTLTETLDDQSGNYEVVQRAYVQALSTLEQNPDVVRVTWQELQEGKVVSEEELVRYRRRSATLGRARGIAARSISTRELTAPAVAAGAGGVAEVATSPEQPVQHGEVAFFTDIRFPKRIKTRTEEPLIIRLTHEQEEQSRVQGPLGRVEFQNTIEYVDVVVVARGFTERFDTWSRRIAVYMDHDSQPAIFLLQAGDDSGVRRISADFYHGEKYIGSVAFDIEIGDRTSGKVALDDSLTAQVALVTLESPPEPADLELRVARQGNVLYFMLHSTKANVGYHWQAMGETKLAADNPLQFLERKYERLSDLAAQPVDSLSEADAAQANRELNTIGEELFEELFPESLRTAYWKRIRKMADDGTVKSLLVTSDEPWIPWEMIKPYQYDDYSDEEESDPFIAERFQVCRWLTGRGPSDSVRIEAAGVIVPDSNLAYVTEEAKYFGKLRDKGVKLGETLRTRADVLQTIREGQIQLLHFAAHANFDAADPNASELALHDGTLAPEDLGNQDIRKIRARNPVVFLNACHTGRINYGLVGLGGWANKLVRQIGVTAFIGSQWEVNDKLASEFAMRFYDALLGAETLGQALHTARMAIRDRQPANPTWLAYTLYGDPNSTVAWGSVELPIDS